MSFLLSSLVNLPRYLCNIFVFSTFLSYEKNPVWNDWRWRVIIPFSFINMLLIIYGIYQTGIGLNIIPSLLWLFVYTMILRFYMLKFDKDTIKNTIKNDPLKSAKWFKWIVGIGLTLSSLGAVLTVLQFVPVVNIVAIPALAILQNFI